MYAYMYMYANDSNVCACMHKCTCLRTKILCALCTLCMHVMSLYTNLYNKLSIHIRVLHVQTLYIRTNMYSHTLYTHKSSVYINPVYTRSRYAHSVHTHKPGKHKVCIHQLRIHTRALHVQTLPTHAHDAYSLYKQELLHKNSAYIHSGFTHLYAHANSTLTDSVHICSHSTDKHNTQNWWQKKHRIMQKSWMQMKDKAYLVHMHANETIHTWRARVQAYAKWYVTYVEKRTTGMPKRNDPVRTGTM
jgi:hypothetical protein